MSNTETLDVRIRNACDVVQQKKKNGESREDILLYLVSIANDLSGPESTASILLLNEKGLLCNGASPGLPADYLAAIDGIKPDPKVGTCAAAAATGQIVITTDFLSDDKWAELRQLPMGIGYRAAWSVPIKSYENIVLGTFGTYFRERRQPTPEERTGIQLLANAAALGLA
jgi:GAF domain-containing protein